MADSGDDSGSVQAPGEATAPALLQTLLARLGDGGDGALGYERLRFRLVTFFRLRLAAQAEALADEAMDRLARRIAAGTPIENPTAYALGIARLLVLEAATRERKETRAAREALCEQQSPAEPPEADAAAAALRACLQAASPQAAAFILEYYGADGGAQRIARRQQLADAAGVTLNALRNRALRIRMALERCVRGKLRADASTGHGPGSDESLNPDTRDMQQDGGWR